MPSETLTTAVEWLLQRQDPAGWWSGELQTNVTMTAEHVLLLRFLGVDHTDIRDGAIHHFFHSELLLAPGDPGQDGRHVDMIWPLWNLFDFTPEGRGEKWYPRLSYSPTARTVTSS